MRLAWPVEIAGTGVCIPEQVVTNDDLAARLDTSDDWITQRTGIRQRRFVPSDKSTLDLAVGAGRAAIADAGLTPQDIDLIIIGTITPDHTLPTTSCELQAALGCRQIPAFDQVSACTGFNWGVITAAQYVISGMAKHVLVVGAECMSRIMDMEDRATAILFGDAAGAAIISKATDPSRMMLAARMGSDGSMAHTIWIPAGGAREPASPRTVNERLHYVRMQGREVYKFAVTKMQTLMHETLDDAGLTADDVKLVIPHQSNLRIIESACEKLGLPPERVMINIDRYGNTSAASVGVALHEARMSGRFARGDLIMLLSFGAGLTWGSALLRF